MKEFLYGPFPITVSKFKCPVCDIVYSELEEAVACCKSHPRIDKVLGHEGVWFAENVPEDIIVEDSTGRKLMYTFASVIKDNETEENSNGKNN